MSDATSVLEVPVGIRELPKLSEVVWRRLFVTAFYASMLEPFIRALAGRFFGHEMAVAIGLQICMYAPFYVYAVARRVDAKLALFFVVLCASVLVPTLQNAGLDTYIRFVKNFASVLLIMSYGRRYAVNFDGHVAIVSQVFALFSIMEFSSYFFAPGLKKSIVGLSFIGRTSNNAYDSTWRTVGLHLNIHATASILALCIGYLYAKRRLALCILPFVAIMFSTAKTWIAYTVVVAILASLRNLKQFLVLVACFGLIVLPVMHDYLAQEFGGESRGSKRMISHIFRYVPAAFENILPAGALPEGYSEDYARANVSHFVSDSEVSFFKWTYQFGLINVLIFLFLIYVYRTRAMNREMRFAFWLSPLNLLHNSQLTFLPVALLLCVMKHSGRNTAGSADVS